jgi:hypothetical protein
MKCSFSFLYLLSRDDNYIFVIFNFCTLSLQGQRDQSLAFFYARNLPLVAAYGHGSNQDMAEFVGAKTVEIRIGEIHLETAPETLDVPLELVLIHTENFCGC